MVAGNAPGGNSPPLRSSSNKPCSPASVKKERTTAGPVQVLQLIP